MAARSLGRRAAVVAAGWVWMGSVIGGVGGVGGVGAAEAAGVVGGTGGTGAVGAVGGTGGEAMSGGVSGEVSGKGREAGGRVFTLTADQVKLLRQLRVVWIAVEAGAPVIDMERPFGSTDVAGDVARILGHPGAPPAWPDELPENVLAAVPVALDAGRLQPGRYIICNAMGERLAAGLPLAPPDGVTVPAFQTAPTLPFEVTADHLKLLARLTFSGFGADLKRPYGDMSYFEIDMAEALGVPVPRRADGSVAFAPQQRARFDTLHGEMAFALQAFLQHAQVAPGTYVLAADPTGPHWRRQ